MLTDAWRVHELTEYLAKDIARADEHGGASIVGWTIVNALRNVLAELKRLQALEAKGDVE